MNTRSIETKVSTDPSQSAISAKERREHCLELEAELLKERSLIIAANRAPVTFSVDEEGEFSYERGGGGLVTALTGLAKYVDATWIGAAITQGDREWGEGYVPLEEDGKIKIKFVIPDEDAYEQYYNVISNPLIWFLQHNMWNIARAPTITSETWEAWEHGYVTVNRMFADAISEQIEESEKPVVVMLQDYQLYLTPGLLRQRIRAGKKRYTLSHFIHIPWPGTEDWGILPSTMRRAILEALLSVDILGFQTVEDGLNFIRTIETHVPRAQVNYRRGRIWYRNHATHIRDFPISIDVDALREMANSPEVVAYRNRFEDQIGDQKLILRIDRTEPSKNIVRGFQSFDEFLDLYPEFQKKVQFLALLVPSRMEVEEYRDYLGELMAAAGRVNAKHGGSEWEPVRVIVGQNYPRAIAALQLYDVLLVNSIADGMNLVAKEGPIVNQKDGVVILSERTGARQQLEPGAIVISPCDVYATAEAIYQALNMQKEDRKEMAMRLRWTIEREDISDWLCRQLETIEELNL